MSCYFLCIEGRGRREPVGGRRRCCCFVYIYLTKEGASESW